MPKNDIKSPNKSYNNNLRQVVSYELTQLKHNFKCSPPWLRLILRARIISTQKSFTRILYFVLLELSITKSKSAKLKELAGGKPIRKKYCAGLVVGESKTNGILVMAHGFESFTSITIKGFGKLDLDG